GRPEAVAGIPAQEQVLAHRIERDDIGEAIAIEVSEELGPRPIAGRGIAGFGPIQVSGACKYRRRARNTNGQIRHRCVVVHGYRIRPVERRVGIGGAAAATVSGTADLTEDARAPVAREVLDVERAAGRNALRCLRGWRPWAEVVGAEIEGD